MVTADLDMEGHPAFSGWAQFTHRVLKRKCMQQQPRPETDDVDEMGKI